MDPKPHIERLRSPADAGKEATRADSIIGLVTLRNVRTISGQLSSVPLAG
jgi:hypothetical protein